MQQQHLADNCSRLSPDDLQLLAQTVATHYRLADIEVQHLSGGFCIHGTSEAAGKHKAQVSVTMTLETAERWIAEMRWLDQLTW